MTDRLHILWTALALALTWPGAAGAQDAQTPADRTYEVYQPRIERYFVNPTGGHGLNYNHCTSIAWFRDRWFCIWNANSVPRDGPTGNTFT